jgi:hypothetical protein
MGKGSGASCERDPFQLSFDASVQGVLLECGHTSLSQDEDGKQTCPICISQNNVADSIPDITGRTARCDCGKEVSSSYDLPFFKLQIQQGVSTTCYNCNEDITQHSQGTLIGVVPAIELESRKKPCPPLKVPGRKAPILPGDNRTRYYHRLVDRQTNFEGIPTQSKDHYYCGHAGWN